MIFTEKKITIKNNQCKIDSPVVLYRGDYNVEVRFTIVSSPYKYSNKQETNIIESTEASFGQLVIETPDTTPIFSEVTATKEGTVIFTITAEMIDEITEVGNYTFQIRLLDENKESRATIPEVVDGIEIREPIATEDITTTNEVGVATVGYAMTTAGTTEDAFDTQGNYNKTTWEAGDRITAEKLNKIEQGITGVNDKVPHYNETLMFEISNGDYSSFVSGSYFNMSALNLDETKLYVGKEINSGEKYNYKFIYDKETDTLISEDDFLYIYNHKSYDGTNFIEDVNSAVLTIDITPMDLSELEGEGYFRLYEVEKLELDNNCLSDNVSIVNSLTVGTRMGDIGKYSVAEGCLTIANAYISHAEGSGTTASGLYSHAESSCTTASGEGSHAEGNGTTASGNYSHTEGISTTASGDYSHAEGRATTTSGIASHAEGNYTIAKSDYQHVQGKYNIEDTTGTYAHIVGNGTSNTARSNAHTLDWQGNAWYQGKISQDGVPTEDKDLTTKKYVDDAIKNNTPTGGSNINDTTASATTTYSSNKIETIKESLNSQIEEIAHYSLVKHTDGKVYIKKQDGTLIGTGVEVGGNTDLSKITMSVEGQTLKLLNDGTQIATVEIPTATVTDEQLTAIIQSKIDDGTLAGMSLGEGSVKELNVEDGAITPNKTNFFKEVYTNLLHGLTTWSNTGYGGTDKDIFGSNITVSDYASTNKSILHTISPIMSSAYGGGYIGKMACYDINKTYLGLATISNGSDVTVNPQNTQHRWIEEFTLLDNTAYVRIGFARPHGLGNNLTDDNLVSTIISYNEVTKDSDPNERIFTVSENYLQTLIDAILIEKSVTSPKLSDTAIKEQFETNANNNSIVDFPHIKFLEQKAGTENLFDYELTVVDNIRPIDPSVNDDIYGLNAILTNMIAVGDNSALCVGMCSKVETSEANHRNALVGVFCFDSTGKYLGKGTKEYVDSKTNKDENSAYVSRYLRFRISSFIENTAYVRITFSRTWINQQDILDTLIIRNSLPTFNENSKLITIKLADNYKLEGVSGGANTTQDNGLAGKNVVWIGDSLTNWGGGSYESPGEGFLGIVHQNTGAITYNQGTAGASWEYGLGTWDESHTTYTPSDDEQYCAIERVNALVANKDTFTPDYVVFMMGTNRRADGTVNDEYTNLHTMCGAMKHCILQIYNTFPNCAMGIVLPPQRNEGMEGQEQANALIKEIAEYYSVPTIDLFHEGGLLNKYRNPLTDTVNSGGFSDGLHLSDLGKNILGRKFTHWIKTL